MIHRARRWVMRFDLSDEDWALLEPLLPKSRKSARVDDRKIMNAIFYVLRTGMPWRDLPARYGPYTTAYNRFNRWSRRGIWKRIFDQLASKSRDSLYLIDSTIVKAHRAASGAKGGRKIRRSVSYQRRERMTRGGSRIAKSLKRLALVVMGTENDGGDCSHPERFDGHRASRGGRSREGQRGVAADVGACNGFRRADEAAQEAFKKTSPQRSQQNSPIIPKESRSKSGSRTRRALASKAR